MKIGKKELSLNILLGVGYKLAQGFGHKTLEVELFGSHEFDEWLNYGLILPVFAANALCGLIEHVTKRELSYDQKFLAGLAVIGGVKLGQYILRPFFGTSWIEPEDVGTYETLPFLNLIRSETARDLIRGLALAPITRLGYEILRTRFYTNLNPT
jgi:hypothetical protein